MRFKIKSLLWLVFVIASGLAVHQSWLAHALKCSSAEEILTDDLHKLWPHGNMSYEVDTVLPNWLRPLASGRLDRFDRIVEFDLRLDNLNEYPTENFAFYTQFKSVRCLRLGHEYLTQELFELLHSFENLERIEIWNWAHHVEDEHRTIDLTKVTIPGVEIVKK